MASQENTLNSYPQKRREIERTRVGEQGCGSCASFQEATNRNLEPAEEACKGTRRQMIRVTHRIGRPHASQAATWHMVPYLISDSPINCWLEIEKASWTFILWGDAGDVGVSVGMDVMRVWAWAHATRSSWV
eukprot:1158258-Pelagomonas_calceolata.AAC.8